MVTSHICTAFRAEVESISSKAMTIRTLIVILVVYPLPLLPLWFCGWQFHYLLWIYTPMSIHRSVFGRDTNVLGKCQCRLSINKVTHSHSNLAPHISILSILDSFHETYPMRVHFFSRTMSKQWLFPNSFYDFSGADRNVRPLKNKYPVWLQYTHTFSETVMN